MVVVLTNSILLVSTAARGLILALTLAGDQWQLLSLIGVIREVLGLGKIVIHGDCFVKVRHLPHFIGCILLPIRVRAIHGVVRLFMNIFDHRRVGIFWRRNWGMAEELTTLGVFAFELSELWRRQEHVDIVLHAHLEALLLEL